MFGLKRGGCWFGFGFSFGAPFGWWGTISVEEELEMLKEYRRWLEGELERVNERIRRLGGEWRMRLKKNVLLTGPPAAGRPR